MHLETDRLVHDAILLMLAWILGGAVGAQRGASGRAAGLRTHMLVCGASCLLSLLSFGGVEQGGRIAAQVISGIGFLGAGVILRQGQSVRGLTTAASVWLVAAIGIAVGAGGRFAALAMLTTVLSLVTLTQARHLESRLQRSAREAALLVTIERSKGVVARMLHVLTNHGAIVLGFDSEEIDGGDTRRRTLRVRLRLGPGTTREALGAALLSAMPQVTFEWED
jgi:putative Mg2+ transporter-C (MgtC) family protein